MRKTALITGGAKGIGAAISSALCRGGWRVVINYNSSEENALALAAELEAEQSLLEKLGRAPFREHPDDAAAIAYKADTTDANAVARMIESIPRISLLVNNAGVSHYGLFHEMNAALWRSVMSVNLDGAANCIRAVLPGMLAEGSGCIINMSSVWGICGASMEAAYSASKAAVIGLTKALAKEYGPSGIRVNCIAPGAIDTDMLSGFTYQDKINIIERTPFCRLGTPEDITGAVLFLASEGASFITGQVIGIDGGFS